MKGRYKQQVTRRLLTSLLGVAACFAVAGRPAFPGEAPQPPAEKPAAVPSGASGMTIYIDPKTGAILSQPAPGTEPLQLTPQEQNAFSTSHEGLVEVPGTEPGGGIKIDLQGRFQSPLVVTPHGSGDKK